MSWDQYNQTPASNDLSGYFATGMSPSKVKNAGWDVMADLAQFMSLPTSGGTANAQTVTNTRQFGALFTGMRVSFIPGNTNTGAVTLAVDGLAAKNIFANGVAAIAGMVVSGVPAHCQYDGTQWNLLNPQRSTGSFTLTLTDPATSGTINYAINPDGKTATFTNYADIIGASGTTTLVGSGLPAILQPATKDPYVTINIRNGSANLVGFMKITHASGSITFGNGLSSVASFPVAFTASGSKGVGVGTYQYPLD